MLDDNFKYNYKNLPIATFHAHKDLTSTNLKVHDNRAFFDKIYLAIHHYHQEIEVILIIDGEAEFTCNQNTYFAKKGDIIIFNPFEPHMGILPLNVHKIEYLCIDFNIDILNGISKILSNEIESFNKSEIKIQTQICNNKKLSDIITELFSYTNNHSPSAVWELKIINLITSFFIELFDNNHIVKNNNLNKDSDSIFTKLVLDYLKVNYSDNISVSTISKEFNYEKSYFCRLFKRLFSTTFHNYLNIYRLNKAKVLLASKNYNITQISMQCGFSSPNYFTRIFTKNFGYPPNKFLEKAFTII